MDDWWAKPGYQNLLVYKLAVRIYDLNTEFCQKYLANEANKPHQAYTANTAYQAHRRTIEQMEQAARSGKQNIVEGSLERSLKSYLKLLGVARGSFGELLEDYQDFLRTRKLPLWDKNDPRVLKIRNQPYKANQAYQAYTANPESFANLLSTLLNQENYLLDQLIRTQEKKFVRQGGYSENLSRQRNEFIKGRWLAAERTEKEKLRRLLKDYPPHLKDYPPHQANQAD